MKLKTRYQWLEVRIEPNDLEQVLARKNISFQFGLVALFDAFTAFLAQIQFILWAGHNETMRHVMLAHPDETMVLVVAMSVVAPLMTLFCITKDFRALDKECKKKYEELKNLGFFYESDFVVRHSHYKEFKKSYKGTVTVTVVYFHAIAFMVTAILWLVFGAPFSWVFLTVAATYAVGGLIVRKFYLTGLDESFGRDKALSYEDLPQGRFEESFFDRFIIRRVKEKKAKEDEEENPSLKEILLAKKGVEK